MTSMLTVRPSDSIKVLELHRLTGPKAEKNRARSMDTVHFDRYQRWYRNRLLLLYSGLRGGQRFPIHIH